MLAVYGFASLPTPPGLKEAIAGFVLLASAPFAWDGQERFFVAPLQFLEKWSVDQWQYLSDKGLTNVLAYLLMVVAFVAAMSVAIMRSPLQRVAFRRWQVLGTSIIFGAIVLLVWFEPVVRTAGSPGYALQRQSAIDGQAGGYIAALQAATSSAPGGVLLTYGNFGAISYTFARWQRIELSDATDLETLLPCIQKRGDRCLSSLGISAAILPPSSSPSYPVFASLLQHLGATSILTIYSPNESTQQDIGAWVVLKPRAPGAW